jgi:hypothetical protein
MFTLREWSTASFTRPLEVKEQTNNERARRQRDAYRALRTGQSSEDLLQGRADGGAVRFCSCMQHAVACEAHGGLLAMRRVTPHAHLSGRHGESELQGVPSPRAVLSAPGAAHASCPRTKHARTSSSSDRTTASASAPAKKEPLRLSTPIARAGCRDADSSACVRRRLPQEQKQRKPHLNDCAPCELAKVLHAKCHVGHAARDCVRARYYGFARCSPLPSMRASGRRCTNPTR